MDMAIRPMQKSDWQEVREIYNQGIQTNIATFETKAPDYEKWDASHLDICRFVCIDTLNGEQITAFTALSPVSSREVYKGVCETSIYVKDTYRGKQIGSALFLHFVQQSEQAGIWMLQSSVFQKNKASIKLHEKCGFRMVGVRELIAKDRLGVWQNTVLMERRSKIIS